MRFFELLFDTEARGLRVFPVIYRGTVFWKEFSLNIKENANNALKCREHFERTLVRPWKGEAQERVVNGR